MILYHIIKENERVLAISMISIFYIYLAGSEVKPWTSGANGRIFRVDPIYLLAILLIANIAGLIHTPTTIWSRSLWLPVITNS